MSRLHDIAQLLIACWAVSGEDKNIPTSHGLLDRVLKTAYDEKILPEWARKELHFVDSRIGLQCVELPAILDWAQKAQLTTAPNPSYRFTEVQISSWAARKLLQGLQLSETKAKVLGNLLRNGLEKAEKQPLNFDMAGVEEY